VIQYIRPAYQALFARVEGDLAAMPAALRAPLSAAWSRACNGMHGHLDWVDAQCSPLTCELERLYASADAGALAERARTRTAWEAAVERLRAVDADIDAAFDDIARTFPLEERREKVKEMQEYLDEDRQLALYAMAVKRMYPDAKQVKLAWNFLAFDNIFLNFLLYFLDYAHYKNSQQK